MATPVTCLVTCGVMLHYSSPLKIVVVSLITQKVETTNVIKPGNVTAALAMGQKIAVAVQKDSFGVEQIAVRQKFICAFPD